MKSLKQAWLLYKENGGTEPFPLHKQICQEFDDIIMEEGLLQGRKFYMGNELSFLQIVRLERNWNKPTIDWGETNKLRDENGELPMGDDGKRVVLYYTTKWHLMCYWNKAKCKVPNKTVYNFKLLRGEKGSRRKMVDLLNSDDLAFMDFELQKRKSHLRHPKV